MVIDLYKIYERARIATMTKGQTRLIDYEVKKGEEENEGIAPNRVTHNSNCIDIDYISIYG